MVEDVVFPFGKKPPPGYRIVRRDGFTLWLGPDGETEGGKAAYRGMWHTYRDAWNHWRMNLKESK